MTTSSSDPSQALSRDEYEKIADALEQWFVSQDIDQRDAVVAMVHTQARCLAKHSDPFAVLESIKHMSSLLLSVVANIKLKQALK